MIDHQDDTLSPVDVIHCVYLARLAQGRGDQDSAVRWQAKADSWLRESPKPTELLSDAREDPDANGPARGP